MFGRTPGTSPLMVSLALVLLVFFLALLALSNVDRQRRDAVLESVHQAFLPKLPGGKTDFTGKVGDIPNPRRNFQQELSEIFETEIPAAKIEARTVSDVTVVRFPEEALFFPKTATLRSSRTAFFDRIIAALSATPQGVLFTVEILVATDYDSSKITDGVSGLYRSRAAALGQIMAERGAAPPAFAVGVKAEDAKAGYASEQVTMIFRSGSAWTTDRKEDASRRDEGTRPDVAHSGKSVSGTAEAGQRD